MRLDIITLFPGFFEAPFKYGIIRRALERKLVQIVVHNLRDYTHNRHRTVDDYPYGGGPGMVLKPEPLFETVEAIKKAIEGEEEIPVILLSPQGRLFSQEYALKLASHSHLILICGRYEGVDERVVEHLVTEELSIGDYVLTGGEPAAVVVVDALVRLLPGALGSALSAGEDSHSRGLLEYPHYTRPAVYKGWKVPAVLLSGNHQEIELWRKEQALRRTLKRRPELLDKAALSHSERVILGKLRYE